MDLNKTKSILKKINRLNDLISELGEANDTEKDLIKAYVVDLYGAVISEESEDLEEQEMLKKIKKQKKLEKKLKKRKLKSIALNNDTEEEIESSKPSSKKVKAEPLKSRPVLEEDTLEPTAYNEVKTPLKSAPVKVVAKAQPAVSSALSELFEINTGEDLSDKLSQTPVTDLTKVMGINEKILTVNELFGGDSKEMNNILVALNGLNSYDEAKSVLMRSVATKYDWADSNKVNKARNFIKLIQRRYN